MFKKTSKTQQDKNLNNRFSLVNFKFLVDL